MIVCMVYKTCFSLSKLFDEPNFSFVFRNRGFVSTWFFIEIGSSSLHRMNPTKKSVPRQQSIVICEVPEVQRTQILMQTHTVSLGRIFIISFFKLLSLGSSPNHVEFAVGFFHSDWWKSPHSESWELVIEYRNEAGHSATSFILRARRCEVLSWEVSTRNFDLRLDLSGFRCLIFLSCSLWLHRLLQTNSKIDLKIRYLIYNVLEIETKVKCCGKH